MTVVPETDSQSQLWKTFKTGRFQNVKYQHTDNYNEANQEMVYDAKGNGVLYEKVIQSKLTPMTVSKITLDIDPVAGLLDGITNPLKEVSIDKSVTKNVALNYQDNTYHKSKSIEQVLVDIDSEIKPNSST